MKKMNLSVNLPVNLSVNGPLKLIVFAIASCLGFFPMATHAGGANPLIIKLTPPTASIPQTPIAPREDKHCTYGGFINGAVRFEFD